MSTVQFNNSTINLNRHSSGTYCYVFSTYFTMFNSKSKVFSHNVSFKNSNFEYECWRFILVVINKIWILLQFVNVPSYILTFLVIVIFE